MLLILIFFYNLNYEILKVELMIKIYNKIKDNKRLIGLLVRRYGRSPLKLD